MKYSIIIPTCSRPREKIAPCLESVIKYTDLADIEIIVIDNGVDEDLHRYLSVVSAGGAITHVRINRQIGYTAATNIGILMSEGEYVVLLNDDAALLPQPVNMWIDLLRKPFEDDGCGITGTVMKYEESIGREFLIFFCVMIRRAVIDKIGILDMVFSPGYGEDIDYCMRAQAAGYGLVRVPAGEEHKPHYDGKMYISHFPIYHAGTSSFKEYDGYSKIVDRNTQTLIDRYGQVNRS